MKFYNTNLTLQNFGSAYLLIVRGATQDVKETFNSFFNWGGVSSNATLDLTENQTDSIGVFWSNDKHLTRYWLNRFLLANPDTNEHEIFSVEFTAKGEPIYTVLSEAAQSYIAENIAVMRDNAEKFMTFEKSYVPAEHVTGSISAEKPDLSFAEAAQAHVSKQQQEAEV